METFIPRCFVPPQQSYFLFGPRGTGKSTFLRRHYGKALWIDLLKPDILRALSARPERLSELIYGNPGKKVVIIDEVQKVPELLTVVHSLIEEDKSRQFILTGSSARKLKRIHTDLLAGRLLWKTLHPFILSETMESSSLEHALQYGLLPIITSSPDPQATLEAYVTLYIREEVQQEGLTRNVGNFSRFLEAISFSHGSLVNVSNIARDCQVERKQVESYIEILMDILLAFKISNFTKKAQRALISHPKFYFFDAGVYRTLRPKGPLDHPEEISGVALEGLVAQHLRAWNAYIGNPYTLYYWRTRSGSEIDFILYGSDGLYAIEVKNSSRVRPEDLRSLLSFRQDYPASKLLLLYRGAEKLLTQGILCLPCSEFLHQLKTTARMPVEEVKE